MGPPVHIGNNCTPGPSVIIEDIHNMGPWSAGPSDTGYYVGRVARMIRNLSLKGLTYNLSQMFQLLIFTTGFRLIRQKYSSRASRQALMQAQATYFLFLPDIGSNPVTEPLFASFTL
jgi:hypothetical protein